MKKREVIAGIHRNTNIRKLGMHSSDTAEITFEDVVVPRSEKRERREGEGEGYREHHRRGRKRVHLSDEAVSG